jgi:hypothetical protein
MQLRFFLQVIGMYDYDNKAADAESLPFAEGSVVTIVGRMADAPDWLLGVTLNEDGGVIAQGRVPANYTERVVCEAKCLHAYTPPPAAGDDDDEQLAFEQGDVIKVTEVAESGWWSGCLPRTKALGVFPSNYAEKVDI